MCNSTQRIQIEEAAAAGQSILSLEKQHGIGRNAITRHMKQCAPVAVQAAAAVAREPEVMGAARQHQASGSNLLGQLERLQTVTMGIIAGAESDKVITLKAVDQARRNIELMARMRGELQPDTTTNNIQITFAQFVNMCEKEGVELRR